MRGVGIIGTGRHGSRYASHILNDIDDLELKAISRRSMEGKYQAASLGVTWYQDWQALVKDQTVEAVISVVPPHLNSVIAKACAQEHKPLLIEKPLAMHGREAEDIVAVMRAARVPLTVGQTLRYNPVIRSMKARITGMGKLHSFTANQRLEPSTLAWHDDRQTAGAGVVIHTAIHVFDALHFITGLKAKRVMAASYQCHSRNLEDLVTILIEMDTGVVGTVDVSKVGHARSGRYEFVCQQGQLYGEQIHSFVEIVNGSTLQRIAEPLPVNTILPLLQDWHGFLNGRNENPVSGEDGLYAVKVCDACLQSAREERWVEVGYGDSESILQHTEDRISP
jgi:predicted dehydrogenase